MHHKDEADSYPMKREICMSATKHYILARKREIIKHIPTNEKSKIKYLPHRNVLQRRVSVSAFDDVACRTNKSFSRDLVAAKNRCSGSIDEMIPDLLVRTEMSFCRE